MIYWKGHVDGCRKQISDTDFRDFCLFRTLKCDSKKDIIIFIGNRRFIACLGNFRVIKVIKSSIQMAVDATNAVNMIYGFVKRIAYCGSNFGAQWMLVSFYGLIFMMILRRSDDF